jgi:hypothetical protein
MKGKDEGNKLLFYFLIGILILIPVVFYFLANKNSKNADINLEDSSEISSEEVEPNIIPAEDYFKDIFTRDLSKNNEELQYFREDPFKSVCGQSGSEENPSVSSNTVCMY